MGDKSAFVGGMKLKISELGKVITGNTPSKKIKEFWDKDDVGFVKPDIISDEHIVKIKNEDCNEFISNAAISKARIVPKNSIFVTCIGNIGKIGVATENLAFNQQINAIIPNENVNLDYLCYAIFANKTRLQDIANAPIVPLLNKSQFSEFELEFDMDINTQTRIVNELNAVSNIILKYKQELLLQDELVRARFVEMFGNPVVNDKKWEIRYFSDLGELKRGKSKHRPRNDPILLGGKYPLIQTGDVTNSNTYIKSYTSTYSEEGLKQSKMWKKGTLCITIAANIAESAILTFDACFPDSVVGFTPNGEVISLFIHYWLSFLQPILEENAPAVAQKNLNVATLEKVGVIVPPLELQNQFASFVQEIDKSRSRIQKSLEASQELFDSLMQEYFG